MPEILVIFEEMKAKGFQISLHSKSCKLWNCEFDLWAADHREGYYGGSPDIKAAVEECYNNFKSGNGFDSRR